jgi:hypothetical protein
MADGTQNTLRRGEFVDNGMLSSFNVPSYFSSYFSSPIEKAPLSMQSQLPSGINSEATCFEGNDGVPDDFTQLRLQTIHLQRENARLRWQMENMRLCQEEAYWQYQMNCHSPPPHAKGQRQKVRAEPVDKKLQQQKAPEFDCDQSTVAGSVPSSFTASMPSSCTGSSIPSSFTGSAVEDVEHSTQMMRHIPTGFCRQKLLDLLDSRGFSGKYNLVYMPLDFKDASNLGYAFVDLISTDVAQDFEEAFQGFHDWGCESEKDCEVSWSIYQGLQAHVDRYRNSPVMHPSVPDEFKPLIFLNGERVGFPEPTKALRAPKHWKQGQQGKENVAESH